MVVVAEMHLGQRTRCRAELGYRPVTHVEHGLVARADQELELRLVKADRTPQMGAQFGVGHIAVGGPVLAARHGGEGPARQLDENRLVGGQAVLGEGDLSVDHGDLVFRVHRDEATGDQRLLADPTPGGIHEGSAGAPVRRVVGGPRQRAQRAQERKGGHDPEDGRAEREQAAQHPAPLHHHGRALDQGGGERIALRRVRCQPVSLLDKRPLGHQVLSPRGQSEAEHEHAGPQRSAEGPGAPVLPVRRAGDAERDGGEQERDGENLLDARRVLGGVAHVRVGQRGHRHRHRGARRMVVGVTHGSGLRSRSR